MSDDAPDPVFHPSVIYQDDRAALDFLEKAFGFEVSLIVEDKGRIVHAEMKYRGAAISVAREFMDDTRSPKSLGGKVTQLIHIQVDGDIDAHCARARAAGAAIFQEPEDQFYGDRTYRCRDPEGHIWVFAQAVKAMSIAEMETASGLKLRESL